MQNLVDIVVRETRAHVLGPCTPEDAQRWLDLNGEPAAANVRRYAVVPAMPDVDDWR
jgi:hypothetical protein